jgi:phospholipase/carboxylesterase
VTPVPTPGSDRAARRLRWPTPVALVVLVVLVGVATYWRPWRLRLQVIQSGGKGPPSLVLLHGFGSSAEAWLPYSKTVSLAPQLRFLFPQGPVAVHRTDSAPDGHAWWKLELAKHLRPRLPGVDLRGEDPKGLVRAGELVRDMLVDHGNRRGRPVMLGGFSQGAMVSCQVAFASDEPLAALILLSGTPSNQTAWRAGIARRKGLPVFMSHGRADQILPFDLAEDLRDTLVVAGLDVTFVAFDGGHEIPEEVVVRLREFLAKVGD